MKEDRAKVLRLLFDIRAAVVDLQGPNGNRDQNRVLMHLIEKIDQCTDELRTGISSRFELTELLKLSVHVVDLLKICIDTLRYKLTRYRKASQYSWRIKNVYREKSETL